MSVRPWYFPGEGAGICERLPVVDAQRQFAALGPEGDALDPDQVTEVEAMGCEKLSSPSTSPHARAAGSCRTGPRGRGTLPCRAPGERRGGRPGGRARCLLFLFQPSVALEDICGRSPLVEALRERIDPYNIPYGAARLFIHRPPPLEGSSGFLPPDCENQAGGRPEMRGVALLRDDPYASPRLAVWWCGDSHGSSTLGSACLAPVRAWRAGRSLSRARSCSPGRGSPVRYVARRGLCRRHRLASSQPVCWRAARPISCAR